MGISWRELEVRRAPGAPPSLVLSGRSKALGLAKGGTQVLLSLTHDGDYAFAQAMLMGAPDTRDAPEEPREEVR
jgi:holo-[acyl-carrier protein] synthase